MKKLLLFIVSAVMSISSYAQEDVTHYIQNASFDADLTWNADGSKKEIVDQSKVLSDRSLAGVAADGSLYALVNPSTPKSRPDGRTHDATNGFVGQILGWEWVNIDNPDKPNPRIESKACEWVYFGVLPYNLGADAVPVADDGTGYLSVPAQPTSFEGGDGALYLRAGWGNSFAYKQVVKLPCAKYRLEYWTINVNSGTSATATDLSQIVCRKETFKEEGGAALTAKEWTKHEFEFTPTAEFTIQFGFQAANSSSNNTPWVFIDGIKLYKIGEANREELLKSDLGDLAAECQDLANTAAVNGFDGLAAYMTDYVFEIEDALEGDADEMEVALREVTARVAEFRLAIAEMSNVNAMLNKMDNLIKTTNYAGKAEFEAAYLKILGYKQDQPAEGVDVVAQILGAVEEATAAIKAYYLSQVATLDNPADYTIFIQHPWFINTDAEPLLQDDIWVFPKQYDEVTGKDRYVEGSASSPDLNSEGWVNNSTASGGDHRLNWKAGRSCWNAWNNNFTGTVSVGQTITDLPNGYYTVAADLITQSGCMNDQHVYAQTTAGKKISTQTLSMEGMDTSEWETISMTADDKVLVVDGKLTIGAEGTGTGSGATGWFCATNFRLFYLGQASDDDIKEAVRATYDVTLKEATDLVQTMHFAADKKTLNDSIEACVINGEMSVEFMLACIERLNAALNAANASEAKYYDYLPTQETLDENPDLLSSKTLLWVKELIEGREVEDHEPFGVSMPIARFAYDYVMMWIASDEATYTKMDATMDLLKNYVNTYAPVFREADQVAAAAKETGKKVLNDLMNAQLATLTAEMQPKSVVDTFVSELKKAMIGVEKQNIWDDANATDYTAYITNPNAEAINGWDIVLGNGDGNGEKSGQWYDGSGTRYFDSYHSEDITDEETGESTHTGLIGFKASQLIKDLPNGTYKVGVYTRTPAEGAYIFAGVADTTFVEIPLNYYIDESTGEPAIASDKYGPIWEEARDAVDAGTATDLQYDIYNANNSQGRGWKHQEIDNLVVTNHELFIGTMCGTEASRTEKVFAGNWYSVGGWTLTLIAKGDNTGWEGPLTGIETIVNDNAVADGIYTIAGVKTGKLQHGLNIVVRNGKALKIMVK